MNATTSPRTWQQVRHVVLAPRARSAGATLLALAIAVVPLVYRASTQGLGRDFATAAALLAVLILPLRYRSVVVPLVVVAVATLVGSRTRMPFGLLLSVNVIAALGAFGRERILGIDLRKNPMSRALAGGAVLAGHVVLLQSRRVTAIALGVGAVVALAVALSGFHPRRLSAAFGFIETAALKIGAGVAATLLTALTAPLIVLAWAAQRITRFDPLSAPTPPGSNWVRRGVTAPELERAYVVVRSVDSPPLARRAHSMLASTLTALAITAFVALVGFIAAPALNLDFFRQADPFQPAAMAEVERLAARDEPWFDDLSADLSKTRTDWDALASFGLLDLESRYVNIVDGERRTWSPPPCECDPIRVWIFGGSTAFGYWQRDDHTIASEYARVATDAGYAVEVRNFAQPAYTLWQEFAQLSARLGAADDAPDVVIFVDGANEFGVQVVRNEQGYGLDPSPASAMDEPMRSLFPRAMGLLQWASDESSERGPDHNLSPEEISEVAHERYEQSRRAARLLVDGAEADAVFVWQPIYSEGPDTGDTDFIGKEIVEEWRRMQAVMSDRLGDDVLDYSALLHGAGEPVFYDLMHLNERGARLLTERLFADTEHLLKRRSQSQR